MWEFRYLLSMEFSQMTESDGKGLSVVLLHTKVHRLQTVHVQQKLSLLPCHSAKKNAKKFCLNYIKPEKLCRMEDLTVCLKQGCQTQFLKGRSPAEFSSNTRTHLGCIRKLRQLTCCLAALWGNDFAGSIFARRHLTKLISDRLLR